MNTPIAAVVLCAGKGTRMKSEAPKVLFPLLGRPLAFYPIARAFEVHAQRVVAVVGHQADAVKSALTPLFSGKALGFALQAEQRGTGDAVAAAKSALSGFVGKVLILYGDVPLLTTQTLQGLISAAAKSTGVLALLSFRLPHPAAYGRVIRDADGKAAKIVEQKDASPQELSVTEMNAGIYLADSAFLFEALGALTPQNAQGELYLTDIVKMAAARGEVTVLEAPLEETAGVNDRVDLAERAASLQARINFAHMRSGVTFEHWQTALVDEAVEIGPDTTIGANVRIAGRCEVGSNVTIGQGSVLHHSTIGDGAEIKPYSVLDEAVVGRHCQVGPFARLRPGTRLDESVHVGNFVETKKAHLKRGTKAGHLSYLGDAEIGEDCNIGAGTITCNYDGVNKHVTTLGNRVFIGSDTQLVAPVSIGDDAFVAAGSTVVEAVPAGSLAMSRTEQTNKLGWTERRNKVLSATKLSK
jgi:bifunctional UDP-N-acetylglucosamine pyrophosphorylase / glucosamine-1-phosphate N-acetyltransferase